MYLAVISHNARTRTRVSLRVPRFPSASFGCALRLPGQASRWLDSLLPAPKPKNVFYHSKSVRCKICLASRDVRRGYKVGPGWAWLAFHLTLGAPKTASLARKMSLLINGGCNSSTPTPAVASSNSITSHAFVQELPNRPSDDAKIPQILDSSNPSDQPL